MSQEMAEKNHRMVAQPVAVIEPRHCAFLHPARPGFFAIEYHDAK